MRRRYLKSLTQVTLTAKWLVDYSLVDHTALLKHQLDISLEGVEAIQVTPMIRQGIRLSHLHKDWETIDGGHLDVMPCSLKSHKIILLWKADVDNSDCSHLSRLRDFILDCDIGTQQALSLVTKPKEFGIIEAFGDQNHWPIGSQILDLFNGEEGSKRDANWVLIYHGDRPVINLWITFPRRPNQLIDIGHGEPRLRGRSLPCCMLRAPSSMAGYGGTQSRKW